MYLLYAPIKIMYTHVCIHASIVSLSFQVIRAHSMPTYRYGSTAFHKSQLVLRALADLLLPISKMMMMIMMMMQQQHSIQVCSTHRRTFAHSSTYSMRAYGDGHVQQHIHVHACLHTHTNML